MLKIGNNESAFLSGFSKQQAQQIQNALQLTTPLRATTTDNNSGLEIVSILLQYNVDQETLLAALLSDPSLKHQLASDVIETEFGPTVAELIKDVTWLNTQQVYSQQMSAQPEQTETLRRMLLSMTHDVRAVLIKLAIRILTLRNSTANDTEFRRFLAQETLDIYAPIANRLGIAQLKWELEDFSFRYIHPKAYKDIAQSLAAKRQYRENCINAFIAILQKVMGKQGIKAEIAGRPKHLYSIWKKMQRKQLGIEELYDLLAVRVIVDQVPACYAVLGIVHGEWQYIPKEFDDYIANPKENGYQSLHTVILDENGNRIEVQIRTREMHDFAELGVAAHWRYKEGSKYNQSSEKSISSLRRLLEDKDNHDGDNLIESFRSELYYDRVYTLTPAGNLVDLIKGSTPLDFAYAIHTQVGHRCRGAKVNGRIVPLTYELQSGERVEILMTKEGGPNPNWINPSLGYAKSPRTINKVKAWFKKQHYEFNQNTGKQILDSECQRLGLEEAPISPLVRHFKFNNAESLYAAIGCGDINTKQIATFLQPPVIKPKKGKPASGSLNSNITVDGLDNIATSFAQCCKPQPGDNIIGFISLSKGITVHTKDCANIKQLDPLQQQKLIDVSWGNQSPNMCISITVTAVNKQGLLNEVMQIVNAMKIDILNARFDITEEMTALLKLDISIKDYTQLSQLLGKIGQLPNVIEVKKSD